MKYGKGMWRDLKLMGRGETDLQPAVDYCQESLRPEGLLVFTDGFTDLPHVSRRVLFVLPKKHNPSFADEARSIYGKSSVVLLK
jgi:predicted metal-dependent peptidase